MKPSTFLNLFLRRNLSDIHRLTHTYIVKLEKLEFKEFLVSVSISLMFHQLDFVLVSLQRPG